MSAYLVIGLATRIVARKRDFKERFILASECKGELDRRFNRSEIYSVHEDKDFIVLDLKPDVAKIEMTPFLKAFYDLRFENKKPETNDILKEVSECDSLEKWAGIAKEHKYENLQSDTLHYSVSIEGDPWKVSHVKIDNIILSLSGPIIMECFNNVCEFFTRLIRERLSDFRLTQGLFVYITD
ncbi:MAG: hypothetical protein K6C07_07455 [Bacteroidales bacterium]|jgi:hypothetical protein|nr:hypothetical protein [Bacteroidales bacterium]